MSCWEITTLDSSKWLQIENRKKIIFFLDHENGKIGGQANLKDYTTKFYKDLFGRPKENSFTLDDEFRDFDITKVSQAENDFLSAPFYRIGNLRSSLCKGT